MRSLPKIVLLLGLYYQAYGQGTITGDAKPINPTGNNSLTGTNTIASSNGVLNPASCASGGPSWCSGSDIVAWTNAAIAALNGSCGEIYIPAGNYTASTWPIIKPRCVKLHGASAQSTIIDFPATGCKAASCAWAIAVNDGQGKSNYPEGTIEDLTISGAGAGTRSGGIFLGGDSGGIGGPGTAYAPMPNHGDHHNINRLRVINFGTAVEIGANAWSETISQSLISNDGTCFYYPNNPSSGERLTFSNSSCQNFSNIGVRIGNSTSVDFRCVNSSFDNFATGSWAFQNGTVADDQQLAIDGCHIEAVSHWIQNYGITTISGGTEFTNGTQSGSSPGYLIDNVRSRGAQHLRRNDV
jgi:hypothetical protein